MPQAPSWRKSYLVGQMTESVRLLVLSGLRQRQLNATPGSIRRRIADLWLGPDLATRVYSPLIEETGGPAA